MRTHLDSLNLAPSESSIILDVYQTHLLEYTKTYLLLQHNLARDPSIPQYQRLEWRLDVEVANRYKGDSEHGRPVYTLDLVTQESTIRMECDYVTLSRMEEELTKAVQSSYSTTARRVEEYL